MSISRFKDALPDGWVYRPKTPDYGIDGEVEIFDEGGCSTGLSFNVQLRATDDDTRADRVSLELDELDYYRSLELPTAVVRYGSPKNSIFWEWGANIASRLKTNEGQKPACILVKMASARKTMPIHKRYLISTFNHFMLKIFRRAKIGQDFRF